jgi:autotransporter-associated beta strand protein
MKSIMSIRFNEDSTVGSPLPRRKVRHPLSPVSRPGMSGLLAGLTALGRWATATHHRADPGGSGAAPGRRRCLLLAAALVSALLGSVSVLASDTWTGAASANWSDPGNWSTGTVPYSLGSSFDVIMAGPGHTTNTASVFHYDLSSLQFAGGAPSFTIHIKNVNIGGAVTNDSGLTQTLEVDAGHGQGAILGFSGSAFVGAVQIINDGSAISGDDPHSGGATTFRGPSSAGLATINNNASQAFDTGSGNTYFQDNASAGSATINNFGGAIDRSGGGTTQFSINSSAGTAAINNFAASGTNATAGTLHFTDASSAGSATITNGGTGAIGSFTEGFTDFSGASSADNAMIFNTGGRAASARGGLTQFDTSSTAGSATIVNYGGEASSALSGETIFNGGGAGNATITNSGGFAAAGGLTRFYEGSAENATINNNAATNLAVATGGQTIFNGGTAGNATVVNGGSSLYNSNVSFESAGITFFHGASSAGSATIFDNGGANGFAAGGQTIFDGSSTAENATIVNNGGQTHFASGGQTTFSDSSSAGNATLIANAGLLGFHSLLSGYGGSIQFLGNSTGGTARVEVFGNGGLDISGHTAPSVTIGSIEGSGFVALGANNLRVGGNNLSTTFSGMAQDGGSGGTGGSLTKIGTGTLTVSGTNAYTGATTVEAGKLVVDGSIAASSGVAVAAGATLSGHGAVSAISGGGTVAPGNSPGILTATHLDPSAGMGYVFDFTQTGSPTYGDAAASGNSVLNLTDSTPFTTALTSANQITIDFSNASLAAGELYRGGFFTDSATPTSMANAADFLYLGTGGFTILFDGFVTEPIAGFADGTVLDGTVLEFEITGAGTSVPDAFSTCTLLLLSLAAAFGLKLQLRRHTPFPL